PSWLPHLDTGVARGLTRGSPDHDALWERCGQDGELTLRTTLNLRDMLRPQVQPGSRLDYVLPPERVTLTFRSRAGFAVKVAAGAVAVKKEEKDGYAATVSLGGTDRVPVEVVLPTGTGSADLRLTWHTAEDARPAAPPPPPRAPLGPDRQGRGAGG